MQGQNRLLDELARIMTTAAGAARGVRDEVDSVVRSQLERIVASMDLVPREEFEAVRAMAQKARAQADALERRVGVLEQALAEALDQDVPLRNRPKATAKRAARRR